MERGRLHLFTVQHRSLEWQSYWSTSLWFRRLNGAPARTETKPKRSSGIIVGCRGVGHTKTKPKRSSGMSVGCRGVGHTKTKSKRSSGMSVGCRGVGHTKTKPNRSFEACPLDLAKWDTQKLSPRKHK